MAAKENFGRWLMRNWRKLAQICQSGRDYKLELQLHPRERKRLAVRHGRVLQDQEKAYMLKNFTTGSKKYGTVIFIDGLKKTQNPQQDWQEVFLSQSQSVSKVWRNDCYFKWKDSYLEGLKGYEKSRKHDTIKRSQ